MHLGFLVHDSLADSWLRLPIASDAKSDATPTPRTAGDLHNHAPRSPCSACSAITSSCRYVRELEVQMKHLSAKVCSVRLPCIGVPPAPSDELAPVIDRDTERGGSPPNSAY